MGEGKREVGKKGGKERGSDTYIDNRGGRTVVGGEHVNDCMWRMECDNIIIYACIICTCM